MVTRLLRAAGVSLLALAVAAPAATPGLAAAPQDGPVTPEACAALGFSAPVEEQLTVSAKRRTATAGVQPRPAFMPPANMATPPPLPIPPVREAFAGPPPPPPPPR
jgi:Ca-activated chloride channel family protein